MEFEFICRFYDSNIFSIIDIKKRDELKMKNNNIYENFIIIINKFIFMMILNFVLKYFCRYLSFYLDK